MTDIDDALRDGILKRVRLIPLPGVALPYTGTEPEAALARLLLGAPLVRGPGGAVDLRCPGAPDRKVTLEPGMTLVKFDGDRFRFVASDSYPFGFMYEEGEELDSPQDSR